MEDVCSALLNVNRTLSETTSSIDSSKPKRVSIYNSPVSSKSKMDSGNKQLQSKIRSIEYYYL